MASALRVAERVLAKAGADPKRPQMVIETIAMSRFFPKFYDDEEPVTQEKRDKIEAKYLARFEEAVDELAAAWGDPYYFGPPDDNTNPWGALGFEDACWERGEFMVCLHYGQEDQELPFMVSVAAVRRSAFASSND